jgi:hypothetical protein
MIAGRTHTQIPRGPVTYRLPLTSTFMPSRNTAARRAFLLAKEPAIVHVAVTGHIVDVNLARPDVVDVESLAVRRKCQAVGCGEVADQ